MPKATVVSQISTLARTAMLIPALAVSGVLLARGGVPLQAPRISRGEALWERNPSLELSVVVPFYNPGPVIVGTVRDIIAVLDAANMSFEVIAVSDGSTDGSAQLLDGIDGRVSVIEQPANMGKGAALHAGFAQARGHHIGMIDADGDIDPSHLLDYTRHAQAGGHDVVYADKRADASVTHASGVRKIVSLTFSTMVTMMFGLGIRDTQTGCKVFSRDAMSAVLPVLVEQRFAFDLEFFVAARDQGIGNMVPAPVTLNPRVEGSSVTAKAILRTLKDAVTVLGRHRITGHYRQVTAQAQPAPHLTVVPMPRPAAGIPAVAASLAVAA